MTMTRGLTTLVATLLLAATTVSATAADPHADPASITGIDWTLMTIASESGQVEVPAEIGASLRLDDDASGFAGCNDFFGGYLLDGDELTFDPLAVTKKLCEGAGQDTEDAYLPALAAVATWAIDSGNRLSLLDADGTEVLAFLSDASGIEGVNWLLRSHVLDGDLMELPGGILVTLRLEDGTASGTGGCNRYSVSYTLDGDSLTFGAIASTFMACLGPAGDAEAAYLENLGAVALWASDGASLTLSDASGAALLGYAAQEPASVVGDWIASGVNNGSGGVVSSAATSDVTATFSVDGELRGSDGCNDYSGTYEVDGDSIAIGPLVTTRKACVDEEVAQTAADYQLALAGATSWAITDTSNLELRDAEGSLQASYVPSGG